MRGSRVARPDIDMLRQVKTLAGGGPGVLFDWQEASPEPADFASRGRGPAVRTCCANDLVARCTVRWKRSERRLWSMGFGDSDEVLAMTSKRAVSSHAGPPIRWSG